MAATGTLAEAPGNIIRGMAGGIVGGMETLDKFVARPLFTRNFGESFRAGLGGGQGVRRVAKDMGDLLGAGYFKAAGDWAQQSALGRLSVSKGVGFGGKIGALGRRGALLGRLGFWGMFPGLAIMGAAEDERGFGVGLAKQGAYFGTMQPLGRMGWHMGAWSGRAGFRAVGKGLSRVGLSTFAKGAGRIFGTTVLPSLFGSVAGVALGGFVLPAAAAWGVGFALHTLPTFARQFRADISRSGFGGDYMDSAGAATMRQMSLQAMSRSHTNARSALGQEGALLHV